MKEVFDKISGLMYGDEFVKKKENMMEAGYNARSIEWLLRLSERQNMAKIESERLEKEKMDMEWFEEY